MITDTLKGPAGAKGDRGDPGPALTNRGRRYARLAGANTGYTTPDANVLDITGAIDLRALVVPDTWATGAVQTLITKWAGVQCSYQLLISADGHLAFAYTTNGSTQRTIQSAASLLSAATAQTTASGLPVWLRVYAVPDDGTTHAAASFYYTTVLEPASGDWTLIDTVQNANVGPWFSGTAAVYLGQVTAGTSTYTGRLYRAKIFNDTTLVAAFDARGASDPPATYTDTQALVWTPLASASLLADEVSDWDFRNKTISIGRVVGSLPGLAAQFEIPIASADRSVDVQQAALAAGGYVCDGVDDHVQIQAAIDALAAVAKPSLVKFASGVVRLLGQKFVTSADIQGKSGVRLMGMGSANTVIIPSLTWAGTNIVKLASVNVEQFSLEDVALDGRKADGIATNGWQFDNTGGSFIVGPDAKHLVQNVITHDCSLSGGIMGVNCRGAKIINTDYYSCGQHGFYLSATDCKVAVLRTSACGTDDGAMLYYGIGVFGSNNQLVDFKANFQRGHNVYVNTSVNYLQGQTQDAWGAGIYLSSNSDNNVIEVIADSNGMQPQAGVAGSDHNIYDNGSRNVIRGISRDRGFAESQADISGNVGNRTAYGICAGPAASKMNWDIAVKNMRKGTLGAGNRTGLKARVMVVDDDAVSDVQIITLKNATGGTFTITDVTSGQTSGAITFSTTAGTLQANAQTALQAMATFGANVTVNSASFAYQFKVVLGGTLANTSRATYTVNGAGLTGSSINIQVNHAIEGGARTSEARIANATVVTT